MLDPKILRTNPDIVRDALKKRGGDASLVDKFLTMDQAWRKNLSEAEILKAHRNEISDKVAKMKKSGEKVEEVIAKMKIVSDKIKSMDEKLKEEEAHLNNLVLDFPNIPHSLVPYGKSAQENKEIRKWGEPKPGGLSHDEIGEKLGILDFARGSKLAGARFTVLMGWGAKLERALINFMLDLHGSRGYKEVFPPLLANRKSLTGTGQLPKFEEDLFSVAGGKFFLIPTAEVPVTNLHADEVLEAKDLTLKYCAYTPCFRQEAGSYGKDVKGIIRQHQFNKVELVKFCKPEDSYNELESLTLDAEEVLKQLDLPYRVMELCTGDLGFSSAKTYDIEVWMPSQKRYREISSCSNFESFQARRANIKFRKTAKDKPEFVHTLNGSGVAVGRCLAAILENFQQPDGTIKLPQVLKNMV